MTRTQLSRYTMMRATLHAMANARVKNWRKTNHGKRAKAGEVIANAIMENQPLGNQGSIVGNNFIGVHRQLLVDGNADNESVSLLYGWMGNVMTAMSLRYNKGNKSMRLGLTVMQRGRTALRAAYQRYYKLGSAGFNGTEKQNFEAAFDLGLEFAPSLSKSELREVFRLADERTKSHSKRMEKRV